MTDAPPAYSTALLTADTWPDFAALVEANGGVWGGCWCLGFHADGFQGNPEANRDLKRELTERGEVHQVLVYDGGRAVGWCQFGSPADLPRIKNVKKYEAGLEGADALPDWRIGCIFTDRRLRERGIATAAVAGALEQIRAAGGGVVEAYPEQTVERKPQRGAFLHTGPEELYAGFGFVRDRQIAKWRWVMRTTV